MTIRDYVASRLGESDDAILAGVNAPTIEHRNPELATVRTLAVKLGMQATAQALGGLKAAAASNPLLDAIYVTLATTGLDFSHDDVQTMISQLQAAGAFSAELATALKAIGRWHTSEAEARLGRPATLADVTAARAQIAREKLEQEATRRINQVWAAIADGTATDAAGIVAAFSA